MNILVSRKNIMKKLFQYRKFVYLTLTAIDCYKSIRDFYEGTGFYSRFFILHSSEYATTLPLVFVFGIATTVSMIHQRLPYHIARHLAIQKFSGQKSTQLLGKLVEALYSDPQVGCKLGGRTLDRLLEMFVMNDFSVKRFLHGFKVRQMKAPLSVSSSSKEDVFFLCR